MAKKLIFWGAAIFFAYNVFLQTIGSYEINYFDGAIQLASQFYVSNKLVPFKDFSLIYSPGQYLLGGIFVPFKSIFISNVFYASLAAALVVYASVLVLRTFQKYDGKYFVAATQLALSAIILRMFGGSGSLPYFLMEVIFLLSISQAKKILIVLSAAFVWLRWDWLLFFAIGRLRATRFPILGYVLGLGTLVIYLALNGILSKAFLYMVYLPLVLQSSFRHLPIPPPTLPIHPEVLIYLAAGITLAIIYRSVRSWSNENVRRFFPAAITYIAIFIPYALARSDWPHFLGIWSAASLVWVMVDVYIDGDHVKWMSKFIIPVFFLPLAGWYVKGVNSLKPEFNKAQMVLNRELRDCKRLTEDYKFDSVFVGRVSYTSFLYNVASLYLLYPDVRPATPNLMEEPGIQNTCEFGEMVSDYLLKSPKPMLAFLEEGDQLPENNATKNMKSCGKIENYLETSVYEKIGECESYEKTFDVRLYK